MIRRYHVDLGLPHMNPSALPTLGAALTYTMHAHQEARLDNVGHLLPASLPSYTLIEVEMLDCAPLKWVVRCGLDNERDVVLAITSDYIVKTVWVNRKNDTHRTLDTRKYNRPDWARTKEMQTA